MNSARKTPKNARRLFLVFVALLLVVTFASWHSVYLALAQDQSVDQDAPISETETLSEEDIPTEDDIQSEDDIQLEEDAQPEGDEISEVQESTETSEETVPPEEGLTDSLRADPEPRATINGQSGSCSWSLNTDTGELRIGAGTLKSSDTASGWSWHSYRVYVKSITFTGSVYTSTEARSMFYNMRNLTTINNFDRLSTAASTNISGMFANCTSLTSIAFPLSFNTARVTDMSLLFFGCTSLTSLNALFFNSSSVTTMANMFEGCTSLIQVRFGSSFALVSGGTLPSPSGQDSAGNLFSGNWKAASNGKVYLPNAIPSYAADTYYADILTPFASISGVPFEGQTLTGAINNGGSYVWLYQWSRSDSENGTFINIPGANSSAYTTTADDMGKYLRFEATYGGVHVFATVGPIEKGVPATPTLNSASLIPDGSILLELTTAASMENVYESIHVAYMTDSGILKQYGELPCYSTSSERRTLSVDISSEFEGENIPTTIYFWIKAKNAAGLSEWSNLKIADPSPQISVTVPTSAIGVVDASGTIITHNSPQIIENTGTLNVKITNISFTQTQESHPLSNWRCALEVNPHTILWEGTSKTSAAVTQSPVIRPGSDIGLVWDGSITDTNGIDLTSIPLDYVTITYTFSFASS